MFLVGLLTLGCAAIAGACMYSASYTITDGAKEVNNKLNEEVKKDRRNRKYQKVINRTNFVYDFDDIEESLNNNNLNENCEPIIPQEDYKVIEDEIKADELKEEERVNEWGDVAMKYILCNSLTFGHYNPFKTIYYGIKASLMNKDEVQRKLNESDYEKGVSFWNKKDISL